MTEPTGMSDMHVRLEKLERKVKIIEKTLQFFFEPQLSVEDAEIELRSNSRYYP